MLPDDVAVPPPGLGTPQEGSVGTRVEICVGGLPLTWGQFCGRRVFWALELRSTSPPRLGRPGSEPSRGSRHGTDAWT